MSSFLPFLSHVMLFSVTKNIARHFKHGYQAQSLCLHVRLPRESPVAVISEPHPW